eukprot:320234-Prorocentrum_minimum.AAC.1
MARWFKLGTDGPPYGSHLLPVKKFACTLSMWSLSTCIQTWFLAHLLAIELFPVLVVPVVIQLCCIVRREQIHKGVSQITPVLEVYGQVEEVVSEAPGHPPPLSAMLVTPP